MNRGSNLCWRTMVGVGVKPFWGNTTGMSQHRIAESRAGRPCSVGIRSERVEAVEGAAGRTTWTCCGRLGRRDERTWQALRCIPRSLVSAPAVHHSMSRWRRPAAGWWGRIHLLCGSTNRRENLGVCHL
jgi:hypothetical protein